jgi:hypothetical protein
MTVAHFVPLIIDPERTNAVKAIVSVLSSKYGIMNMTYSVGEAIHELSPARSGQSRPHRRGT